MIDAKWIKNIQGKDFVLFEGLLDTAHKANLKSIETDLVQIPDESNHQTCIVTARVTMDDDRVFTGIGDANAQNVNRMIAPHVVRMAETRAIARALRLACNIGATAFEELGDVHPSEPDRAPAPPRNAAMTEGQIATIRTILEMDGAYLTDKEAERLEQYISEQGGFSQAVAAKAITTVVGLIKERKAEAEKASA